MRIAIRVQSGMLDVYLIDDDDIVRAHASELAYSTSADGLGDMTTEEMLALTGFTVGA